MIILQRYEISTDRKWLYITAEINPNVADGHFTAISLSTNGTEVTLLLDTLQAALLAAEVDFSLDVTKLDLRVDLEATPETPIWLTLLADGTIPDTLNCSYKKNLTSVTYYKYPMYKTLKCMVADLEGCEPPRELLDFLIRLKALEAAIALDDKEAILKYYDLLRGKNKHINTSKPCGCRR